METIEIYKKASIENFKKAFKVFTIELKKKSSKLAYLQLVAKQEIFLTQELVYFLSKRFPDYIVAPNFGNKNKYDICFVKEINDKNIIDLTIEFKYITNLSRWWNVNDPNTLAAIRELSRQLEEQENLKFENEIYELTKTAKKPIGLVFISFIGDNQNKKEEFFKKIKSYATNKIMAKDSNLKAFSKCEIKEVYVDEKIKDRNISLFTGFWEI